MLSEKALLAKLSIGKWTGKKTDKRANNAISELFSTDKKAGRYVKDLLDRKAIRKIETIEMKARKAHNELTLPWLDGGIRLLPAKMFEDYLLKMKELQAEFESEVNNLVENYYNLRAKSMQRLGDLADSTEYPSGEKLKSKFYFDLKFFPIAESDDFRVKISEEQEKELKEQIERQNKQMMEEMTTDLWQRMYEAVKHLYETAKDTDKRFSKNNVTNIIKLVELLPKLNVTNDPKLDELAGEMKKSLCTLEPEEIRKDETARENAANEAKQVLDKMSAFGFVGGE